MNRPQATVLVLALISQSVALGARIANGAELIQSIVIAAALAIAVLHHVWRKP